MHVYVVLDTVILGIKPSSSAVSTINLREILPPNDTHLKMNFGNMFITVNPGQPQHTMGCFY